ncbi:hypothetical protein HKX48_002820 [Thoreauomyces humboldtii]|nr:hypothetical protein HKX48_002820 [Thoreauomyces humboldtii]
MTRSELEALKRGEVALDIGLPPLPALAPESNISRTPSSITIPRYPEAVVVQGKSYFGFQSPPPIADPNIRPIEAAFLTSANTSNRRGFVELDDSLFNIAPAGKPPASRQEVSPAPKSAKLIEAEERAARNRKRKQQEETNVITSPAVWDAINLTFLPTKRNFLGEGRYAQVFMGFYTITEATRPTSSPFPSSSPRPSGQSLPADISQQLRELGSPTRSTSNPDFLVCAVKRLHHTQEAQSIGLCEVYLLRKLSPLHPNIIKFIGVKDEADVDNPNVKSDLAAAFSFDLRSPPEAVGNATKRDSLGAAKVVDPAPKLLVLLEYLPKGNMWDWVARNKEDVGRRLWIKWARQLASAVECMHVQGVIHHDIKPHNILLSEYLDVRLADFGNACFTLHMGLVRGTAPYSAPELFTPALPYSFPVDIYSLGVTLYTLITGVEPFSLARTTTQLYMGVRRGFFASGLQLGVSAEGIVAQALAAAAGAAATSPTSPLSARGPITGSVPRVRFLNGDTVDLRICEIVQRCLDPDPSKRFSAAELVAELDKLE